MCAHTFICGIHSENINQNGMATGTVSRIDIRYKQSSPILWSTKYYYGTMKAQSEVTYRSVWVASCTKENGFSFPSARPQFSVWTNQIEYDIIWCCSFCSALESFLRLRYWCWLHNVARLTFTNSLSSYLYHVNSKSLNVIIVAIQFSANLYYVRHSDESCVEWIRDDLPFHWQRPTPNVYEACETRKFIRAILNATMTSLSIQMTNKKSTKEMEGVAYSPVAFAQFKKCDANI